MTTSSEIVREILGGEVDKRFDARPALQRLASVYRAEAVAVEGELSGWVSELEGEPSAIVRGLLSELGLCRFLQSTLVAKLADSKEVVTQKGQLSPAVTGIRQLSETILRIEDRLREEIPKKTPKAVSVADLWAAASRPQDSVETASGSTEKVCPGTEADADSDGYQTTPVGDGEEGA